ncbi:MAG: type II secretion system major pseudopilin GspG [Bdellovibrionota bacterium]
MSKQLRNWARFSGRKAARRQLGFSLIEIMIVITLIGMIMTFGVRKYMASLEEGNRRGAKIMLRNIQTALDDYLRVCHAYPTTAQGGLEALVRGAGDGSCKEYSPNMKNVPKDPWSTDYFYLSDDGRKYVLKSYGPDKKEGGEGNDKDISVDDPDF